jgi:phospholipid/cholesterol/gamma-HCH transport system permease protein
MLRYLRLLGQWALGWIAALGRASMVWFQSMAGLPRRGDMTLLLKQVYQIGVLSLIIIVMSAFSIGAVLALQGYTQLARVGAEESVGVAVALVLLRELGPWSPASVRRTSRFRVTAEIGPDEGDRPAVEHGMIGVDAAPDHRAATRAGMICMPLPLTVIFSRWLSAVPRSSASTGSASIAAASGAACRTVCSAGKTSAKGW